MRLPAVLALLALAGLSVACHPHPRSPLTVAAYAGDDAQVQRLLASGSPPDGAGDDLTPLIWASRAGQTGVIRTLLAHGADPGRVGGGNGWSPLVHAVHKSQLAAAELLLEAGPRAAVEIDQALQMAAGYGDAPLVSTLLTHGANPRAGGGATGVTILSEAIGGAWDIDYQWRGCEPHTAVVRELLAAAPDLTLPDTAASRAALRFAESKGCAELVSLVKIAPSKDRAAAPSM